MTFAIVLLALVLLMVAAYRGYSVILFAPLAAMLAVLLTDPSAVPSVFTGLFMERMVGFLKLYFPVFLLGAVFGKLIELSGFSQSIAAAVIRLVGQERAILSIVLVCALLTYGGVPLFVVVFAVYPFAAEMFRRGDIPKRLIPGTIALGAFTFTMDSLPGTPQIQNIIPTTFFGTTTWAAPLLGTIGGAFILTCGLLYLEWRRRQAMRSGEGYGTGHSNEPEQVTGGNSDASAGRHPAPAGRGHCQSVLYAAHPATLRADDRDAPRRARATIGHAAVERRCDLGRDGRVVVGHRDRAAVCVPSGRDKVCGRHEDGGRWRALLASMNTASEYGFGAVIAALPGFLIIRNALMSIPDPLVNEAITVTTLAGVTGSASGGLSIALAAMSEHFMSAAQAANIPPEVLHRVAAMASGGMDTLPHNGAVITLLAVTGLTHRQSYKDIFAITCVKTLAVFFVIGVYYATGIV